MAGHGQSFVNKLDMVWICTVVSVLLPPTDRRGAGGVFSWGEAAACTGPQRGPLDLALLRRTGFGGILSSTSTLAPV